MLFWIVFGVLVILFLVWVTGGVESDWDRESFDQKWPPISDEEFLAKCPVNTSREVALKVRQIVSECLDFPYDQVYPQQRFVEDLNAD